MDFLFAFLGASWTMLVEAGPYILFGLAVAGLMHVLLPESLVLRWMGAPGLWGVVRAAVIGVPLPVCSCGVVPITVELRRKGASRPAAQSFLITTPESSIDSIFLTWGMMGPVMAIARPIAAFFTAVIGGILSIASAHSLDELTSRRNQLANGDAPNEDDPDVSASEHGSQAHPEADHHHEHDHGHHEHDHGHHEHDHGHHEHDHGHHEHDHGHHHHHHHHHHGHHHHDHDHSVAFAGSARARLALRRALSFKSRSPEPSAENPQDADNPPDVAEDDDTSLWRDLVRPALRYGFGQLLDDLAFWLVIGIGLAGLLAVLLPDNLEELGLGTGLLPMIALLIVGIPLYMCASASTPIAATLLLKGFSPGAALVFLLAGPATNAATVLQLAATFGRRFVQIYVISVAVGALAAGLLLDLLLGDIDVTEGLRLSENTQPGGLMVAMALLLAALLARSLYRGAWALGVEELRIAGQRMRPYLPSLGGIKRRHLIAAGLLALLMAYAISGFRVVPVGARGYGFVFGALVRSELEPGLHYLPPAPIGRWDVRHVEYPRKSDVGFRTDLSLFERRRELVRRSSEDAWHSPVAAMNPRPVQASYLTGDGNLVEVSFSVHYALKDPETFFYRIDHGRDFVNLYAEAVARELIAGLPLDELLTERRAEFEGRLRDALETALDEQQLGISVLAVKIVDLHPPGPAVFAFRDVSSAREDRETAIHKARGEQARTIPESRGEAARRIAEAEALAARQSLEAKGESEAFSAQTSTFRKHRDVLGHLLWIETVERTLAGREKLILPPDRGPSTSRGITLWRQAQPPLPTFPEDER